MRGWAECTGGSTEKKLIEGLCWKLCIGITSLQKGPVVLTTVIKVYCIGNISLLDNGSKKQLDAILMSCNLSSTENFNSRICNQSISAIDSIFIDTVQFRHYTFPPIINGLYDHDTQLIVTDDINLWMQNYYIKTIRNINRNSMVKFQTKFSYKLWENVFDNYNNMEADNSFNSFLNTCLSLFCSDFSSKKEIKWEK